MSTYKVKIGVRARQKISKRAKYIAIDCKSPQTAIDYVHGLEAFCQSLSAFPYRSINRDDIRIGLRITNYKRTTIVAYRIDEATKSVIILDIYHSSQRYEQYLKPVKI